MKNTESQDLVITTPSCFNNTNNEPKKMLTYKDGSVHNVTIPYCNWSSGQVGSQIRYILLTEIMDYSTEFLNIATYDDEAVSYLVGCANPDDPNCPVRNEDRPILHFSIESWMSGLDRARGFPLSFRPALLSVLSYNLDDGYFLWQRVIDDGLNASVPLLLSEDRKSVV